MFKKSLPLFAACAALLAITACSSSDDADNDGRASAPLSVSGATISFNPTITFSDGTNFLYTNTETGTTFPAGTISGTYIFNRVNDLQATITLNAADIGGTGVDTLDLVLTNFKGTPFAIFTFDIEVDGTSYEGRVTVGTMAPKPEPADEDDTDEGPTGSIPNDPNAEPATIDPGFVGTHTLKFAEAAGPSPFTNGQEVTFEITADGTLSFEGKTLTGAFFLYGNTLEVIWFDGTYGYAASGSGSLNEINVGAGYDYQGDFTFLGQFSNK